MPSAWITLSSLLGEAADRPYPDVSDDRFRDAIVRSVLSVEVPLRIVLFGSRSRGDNRPNSDWDVAVVIRNSTPRQVWRRMQAAFRTAMARMGVDPYWVDIFFWTEADVAGRNALADRVMSGVDGRPIVLFQG